MNLIKENNNLFESVTQIKKLKTKLDKLQIKECMYKYKAQSTYKTNVEINEWDGVTVMLKGKNTDSIENDWKCLLEIIEDIVKNKKEKPVQKSEFEKKFFITDKNRSYTRPYDILSSNYVNQYPNGRIYITGHVARLMDAIDKYILKFAQAENALEFYSEPLWYEDELEKFGYTKDNDNLFKINNFNDESGVYWQNTVCDNIWESIENSRIDNFKTYTSIGVCSRTERNQTYFWERMNVFHMREVVAVGTKEDILNFRKRAVQFVVDFAQKLNLNFLLEEASDPFFIEDGDKVSNNKFDLPEIVKVEYRPCLYDNKSLACASFNVHGDFFAQKFNYTSKNKGEKVWTSCIAFGLERWCWAILVQLGTDKDKWPEFLRNLLE
ncbi:hypothetical protein KYB31_13845 [Clostridium felsineum]|uniref:hypothetical protein n=1 Tax=Clostridium felsineum TaxID=36839 RepID=UPI00214D273B|nr:hypothetical protein [Clostridium felsineum]MCR3760055.1 hypothetical protein [Clostridium felsineum]